MLNWEPITPLPVGGPKTWDLKYYAEFHADMDREIWPGPDGTLTTLERAIGLDLGPLRHTADQGFEAEDWLAMAFNNDETRWPEAEQLAREAAAANEAAWQEPRPLMACLRALIAAIDARPDVFGRVGDATFAGRDYYAGGGLRAQLAEFLFQAEWAVAHGAQRLRFVVA
jgi:hypothetical protein